MSKIVNLGKLPIDFINKIPNYTFTKLLLNNFNTFVIENNNYVLERMPPIYVNETKYINLIMNEKDDGIKLGSSTFVEKKHDKCPFYNAKIYFHYKNYYVEEEMNYNGHKECKYCNVWNYTMQFKNPNNEKLYHNENYCGQMMLMDYTVNKEIKGLYKDLEKHLQKKL